MAHYPSQPLPAPFKATSPNHQQPLLTAHLLAGQQCTQTKLYQEKERSVCSSILGLFFCCISCFLLLVGGRLLDVLNSNPLVLRPQ